MTDRILITGATGKTGSALAGRLRACGANIRTATRKPVMSDDVHFEWHAPETHGFALDGVNALYLVAPTDTTEHLTVMQLFLDRAVKAGVERVVLLSASVLDQGGPMMGAVHAWLAVNVPQWTVLRPSWFMQNFVTQHLPAILQQGAIYSATQNGRVPFIDVADIAAVAAKALTEPGFTHGRAPILTGPVALTYAEVAQVISTETGRDVRHVNLTFDEMTDHYRRFGLPADYAAVLAGLDDAIAHGSENRITNEVEHLCGRRPNSFEIFVRENRHVWQSQVLNN